MQNYILTERGKLLVAAIITFFLILPSLILVIWVLPRVSSSNESKHGSNEGHHNGSSLSDPDSPQGSPGNNANGSDTPDPSLTGMRSFDFDEGIMTFLYTPELQNALDDNITFMIGELITSPKKTDETKFSVEIPQLPDGETATLTTAIINAFNSHGIKIGDIVFYVYPLIPGEQTFEIKMSIQ